MILQKANPVAYLMVTLTTLSNFIQRLNRYWLAVVVLIVVALATDIFIFHAIYTSQIPHTTAAAQMDLMLLEMLNIGRIVIVFSILFGIYLLIIRPMTQRLHQKTEEWAEELQRRHATEQALRESEARYRLLAENATDVISRHDSTGHVLYITPNCSESLGYSIREMLGVSARTFFHPDDVPLLDSILVQLVATPGFVFTLLYRIRHLQGHYLWIESTIKSIPATDQQPLEIIAISRNISDRIAIKQQLEEKERFIERVLDAIPDVVYVQDIQGKQKLYSNRSLSALLGYQPHEIEALGSENFTQLMHAEDLQHLPAQWEKQRMAADDEVIVSEFRLKNRANEWVWVRSRELVFERDKHGSPRQILTTLQDITQEKRLAQQRILLEMEQHQRSMIAEFIQNASHDFRTPLTIIGNTAYLMSRYDDAAKRAEKMQRIQQQIYHLGSLLDDILLLTELDISGLTQREKLELNHLISDHLVGLDIERRLEFLAHPTPLWLMGNGALLDKALGAVLKNARTHTPPEGSITISTHAKPGWAMIRVHNTGEIIPPEVLPHIFDRFYRGDAGRSPDKGGMGLGLTITQKIVQSHYGVISVTSSAENGTLFEICLPMS
jgi:PAS domain S-box-containing protein